MSAGRAHPVNATLISNRDLIKTYANVSSLGGAATTERVCFQAALHLIATVLDVRLVDCEITINTSD